MNTSTKTEIKRWQKIYYPCYRFYYEYNPKQLYREAKYFIQRGKRGWSDRDWWGTNYYLKDVIPPMLRKQANDGVGYPGILPYDTANKWEKALLKAADDIEAFFIFEEKPLPKNFKNSEKARDKYYASSKKAQERTKSGMHFVAENFLNLWD